MLVYYSNFFDKIFKFYCSDYNKYEGVMTELTKALEMGEYGIYVWPSFAVAAFVILIMLVVTLRSLHHTQKTLNDLQEYQEQK